MYGETSTSGAVLGAATSTAVVTGTNTMLAKTGATQIIASILTGLLLVLLVVLLAGVSNRIIFSKNN